MKARQPLSVISKARMTTKIEMVIGDLRSLHKLAIDHGAQKNLKRAIILTENVLRIYQRQQPQN